METYFLLRTGMSPAYFSLTDFLNGYSIELFYIAVVFSLIFGWIFLPALALYTVLIAPLAWLGKKVIGMPRYQGIPIFTAVLQRNREDSVSLEIAKDFAKSNSENGLLSRIEEYSAKATTNLSNEMQATANYSLLAAIAYITYATGAPNFLTKVTAFADPLVFDKAYTVCLYLILVQGIVGRISGFHRLRATVYLPPSFFINEEERLKCKAWVYKTIERNEPLAKRWLNKTYSKHKD